MLKCDVYVPSNIIANFLEEYIKTNFPDAENIKVSNVSVGKVSYTTILKG